MKKSTSGRFFLLAHQEEVIDARIDLSLEAFWHHTECVDDIVSAIVSARDELSAMVIAPLLPIIHTHKLLSEIEVMLRANPEEISQESFVSAILRATDWVGGAGCAVYAERYFANLTEGGLGLPPPRESEEACNHGEFGFVVECAPQKEFGPLIPLLYLLAAVEGMLNLYKERLEASELIDPRFHDRKLLREKQKEPTR
jgi:hypothetical protein